jgi:hypothetical protein
MAKIGWKGLTTSLVYGALDLGIEVGTQSNPAVMTGNPLSWGDLERFIVLLGSGAANMFTNTGMGITEPLFYSSLPLAIRSVYRLAANATSVPGYSRAMVSTNRFTPVPTVAPVGVPSGGVPRATAAAQRVFG